MKKNIIQTYLFSLISLLVLGVYATVHQKFFSSDGANYLFTLIEKGDLYSFQNGRFAAHYILKLPSWILIKVGINSFETLSFTMGFVFYLQMILGIVFSYNILRDENKKYIIYPILSTFIFSLNTEYAIESESIFLNSMFWPVFFYFYEFRGFRLSFLFYILLLFVTSFSYETFCIASICIGYAIFRNSFLDVKLKVPLYCYLLCVSIFQFYNIIFHQYPDNVHRYVNSIVYGYFGLSSSGFNLFPYWNIYFIFLMFFVLFLVTALFRKNLQRNSYLFVMTILGISILCICFLYPASITRYFQFATRSLTSIAPVVLSVTFFSFFRFNNIISYNFSFRCVNLIILFQLLLSIITTRHWIDFKDHLNETLQSKRGIVFVGETSFQEKVDNGKVARNYLSWSLPLYSIFLDEDKVIDTILYNNVNQRTTRGLIDRIEKNTDILNKYGFKMSIYDR